jgi:hypothetical protein
MRHLTIFFCLIISTLICYSQNSDNRTITIKIPKIKISPSISLGYVSPFRDAGGTVGCGLNSQINFPTGKYFYFGLNYNLQITGYPNNFDKDYIWKLNVFGGALGVIFPIKNDLSLTCGTTINKGLFSPSTENPSWHNIYIVEMALKYKLNKRFNFINKVQFGGNNIEIRTYNNSMTFPLTYRTLNFLFGVEFN